VKLLLALLLSSAPSFACEVNIAVSKQVQSRWCWLAVSGAILDKEDVCTDLETDNLGQQCRLMRRSAEIGLVDPECGKNCLACNRGAGSLQVVEDLVEFESERGVSVCQRGHKLEGHSKNLHLSRAKTKDKLCKDTPIMAGVSFKFKSLVPEHVVILFRESDEHYWIKDPWDPKVWGAEDEWLKLGATIEPDGSYKMRKEVLESVWHTSTWFDKVKTKRDVSKPKG
jgi:hypothetical protein